MLFDETFTRKGEVLQKINLVETVTCPPLSVLFLRSNGKSWPLSWKPHTFLTPLYGWVWLVLANGMQLLGHLQCRGQAICPGLPSFPFLVS